MRQKAKPGADSQTGISPGQAAACRAGALSRTSIRDSKLSQSVSDAALFTLSNC